jgi:hypothetical protein
MQEEVDVYSQRPFEDIHELISRKLRSKELLKWDLGARSGNLNASHTALDKKDANFVARYREVDLVPLPFWISLPRDNHPPVCESPRRVFERAELWFSAGSLKFSLVVVLFGER